MTFYERNTSFGIGSEQIAKQTNANAISFDKNGNSKQSVQAHPKKL